MRRFSVIIPTWKNLACLDAAYRSVVEHSGADHELIVFFNEYDEECERWLEGKNVIHGYSDSNLGVCGAVNRASELMTTDYICFMNDDMYALPGWDTALSCYLGMSDKLWLSGTAVEAGKATTCYIGGHDYGDSPETFQESKLLAEHERLRRPYNVVSTWTPILLSRRDWEAIGGFDEEYFPGNGSDPDLAMKMYRHGCRYFIGVGASLVYHFSRTTISRFDSKKTGLMDPRVYFKKKWGVSRRRFLNRMICRDRVVTAEYLEKVQHTS